jgi:hypothetical protein
VTSPPWSVDPVWKSVQEMPPPQAHILFSTEEKIT